MDYRSLFGIGFIILASGYFVRSVQSASAFPQGPNVGLGSNPVVSWAGYTSSGSWTTLDTLQADFVLTDLVLSGTSDYCDVYLSSQNSGGNSNVLAAGAYRNDSYRNGNSQFTGNFNTGMKIPAGTTLYAYASGYCSYNISGYYVHP